MDVADELGADIILGNNKKNDLVPKVHEFFASIDREKPILDWYDINDGNVDYEDMIIENEMLALEKLENLNYYQYILLVDSKSKLKLKPFIAFISMSFLFKMSGINHTL